MNVVVNEKEVEELKWKNESRRKRKLLCVMFLLSVRDECVFDMCLTDGKYHMVNVSGRDKPISNWKETKPSNIEHRIYEFAAKWIDRMPKKHQHRVRWTPLNLNLNVCIIAERTRKYGVFSLHAVNIRSTGKKCGTIWGHFLPSKKFDKKIHRVNFARFFLVEQKNEEKITERHF